MARRPKRSCQDDHCKKVTHSLDVKKLAKSSIEDYFKTKNWFAGGPIPKQELLSDQSIKTVLNTPFDDSTFTFIHENCLVKIPQPSSYTEPSLPWTVEFLLELLREMKSLGLPKDFQPGLVLLYFKFCRGMAIPNPPEFINEHERS
jgi:hypothetical protein